MLGGSCSAPCVEGARGVHPTPNSNTLLDGEGHELVQKNAAQNGLEAQIAARLHLYTFNGPFSLFQFAGDTRAPVAIL